MAHPSDLAGERDRQAGEPPMSGPDHPPARRSWLRTILVFLAGLGIGVIGEDWARFLSGLAPEYNSARTISEITAFVEKNRVWPTSWQALGREPLDRVKVDWSVEIKSCDRHDVMMSVAPATGGFYTYPHAKRQLEDLWQVVLKIQQEQASDTGNGSQ